MEYIQNYNPLGNVWFSALVASLPIILFFVCLVVFKLKGHVAGFLTALSAALIASFVYDMPLDKVGASLSYGFLSGLWPIAWIIIAAIFLYKLSVKSGYFDILRDSIIAITPDQRIQVILIGFCFGAFLEGAIGFGGPVAITSALLVGFGLRPLQAAGLCMIANTAPVAFGAVGIPITAMANLVGIQAISISAMTGVMLVPFSIFIPFFLVFLMDGLKGVKETWPVLIVAGVSFAVVQCLASIYLGPELPSIASAIVSIVATAVFLRFWQPKHIFKFKTDSNEVKEVKEVKKYSFGKILQAWSPFIVLVIVIVIWTSDPFKALFSQGQVFSHTNFGIHFKALETVFQIPPVVEAQKAVKSVFAFPLVNNVGTAILVAAIITIFMLGVKVSSAVVTFIEVLNEMKFAVLTIGLVLAFAFIANNSGISASLALALAHTGNAFAFFSPFVGWLGVFLTGSDTSSNLLFGTLQQITAKGLNMPEILFLAVNTVGGVVGKMISPQTIAIVSASVGLVGKESDLFRFTVKYSLIFVVFIGLMTAFIAFVVPDMVPKV